MPVGELLESSTGPCGKLVFASLRSHGRGKSSTASLPDGFVAVREQVELRAARAKAFWRRRLNIEPAGCDALGHSFLSILVAQGKTWGQIAAFVGHLDRRTTQRYIHFMPKDKRDTANSIPFEF